MLHGPAAREWLRGLGGWGVLHCGVTELSARYHNIVVVGNRGAHLASSEVLTLMVTVFDGRIRRARAFRSSSSTSLEHVYDTQTGREMAALGWRAFDPAHDGARWLAIRARVERLPETPRLDSVWLRDGAAFVSTGWIGLVGLLLEEPDGPIHSIGSMGQFPPPVHAWAWARGLSMAESGAARQQTVRLESSDPGKLSEIMAELRRWNPELAPAASGDLVGVDLYLVWDMLYDGETQGWLRLTLR